jgi:hypothetical protein
MTRAQRLVDRSRQNVGREAFARWLWLALGAVGILSIVWYWLAPIVVKAVADYFDADVPTRDQLTSPYSLALGFASLVVSIIGLRRSRPVSPPVVEVLAGAVVVPSAGMTSLAVPALESAELLVRGRDQLIAELVRMHTWRGRRNCDRVRILYGMGGQGRQPSPNRSRSRQRGMGYRCGGSQRPTRRSCRPERESLRDSSEQQSKSWTASGPRTLLTSCGAD